MTTDALSRLPIEGGQINTLTIAIPPWYQEVRDSDTQDAVARSYIQEIQQTGPSQSHYYTYENGLLRYKGKVYIGRDTTVREMILNLVHSSSEGGHSG